MVLRVIVIFKVLTEPQPLYQCSIGNIYPEDDTGVDLVFLLSMQ